MRTSIHPRDIERGDRFISPFTDEVRWVALEGAVTRADEMIRCEVQFHDGTVGERAWSALDPTMKIVVYRRDNAETAGSSGS